MQLQSAPLRTVLNRRLQQASAKPSTPEPLIDDQIVDQADRAAVRDIGEEVEIDEPAGLAVHLGNPGGVPLIREGFGPGRMPTFELCGHELLEKGMNDVQIALCRTPHTHGGLLTG
jgi:hypothetical protein